MGSCNFLLQNNRHLTIPFLSQYSNELLDFERLFYLELFKRGKFEQKKNWLVAIMKWGVSEGK